MTEKFNPYGYWRRAKAAGLKMTRGPDNTINFWTTKETPEIAALKNELRGPANTDRRDAVLDLVFPV